MSDNTARTNAQSNNLSQGIQFNAPDGSTITNNPTTDPRYPSGSQYVARTNPDGSKDKTMIVGPDGTILNSNN